MKQTKLLFTLLPVLIVSFLFGMKTNKINHHKETRKFIKKQFINPNDTIVPFDSTLYKFTKKDIAEIRKQIPEEKKIFDLHDVFYSIGDIHSFLVSFDGIKYANKYIYLYKKYGKKITDEELKEKQIKEREQRKLDNEHCKREAEKRKREKELFRQRLKTGEKFKLEGISASFSYEKIITVQPILRSTFPDVDFYYFHKHQHTSGDNSRNLIKLVYKDESIHQTHLNKLFFLNDPEEKISFNDKIKCLIILHESNLDTKVELLSISDVSKKINNSSDFVFNKLVTAKVNNLKKSYYLRTDKNQFLGIAEKGDNNSLFYISIFSKYIK